LPGEDIKPTILKEIEKTKKVILEYEEMSKPVAPDVAIGRISRIDAIQNKSITEASLRQARTKLKQLEVVLSQVGKPDFGLCQKCKNEIPLGRILIRPESLLCVNCAV
jgi:DnaK suppressor protein